MILPDFILTTRANQSWDYNGLDSEDECICKSYFKHYPYKVNYKYNSRGFRDEEWPENIDELKNSIWCFGDSFTAGFGCPYEYIWTKKLEKYTKIRTINVSMDGASNEWISRKVLSVIKEIDPKFIVIHWSYFDRRESSNKELTDEDRRIFLLTEDDYRKNKHKEHLQENLKNTLKCIKNVETSNYSGKIIHSIIYDETSNYPFGTRRSIHNLVKSVCKSENYIDLIEKIDLARDGHHYGVRTSDRFAKKISTYIKG